MKRILLLCMLCAVILSALFALCACAGTQTVYIDVIAIGKADCILIRTGTKTVMIDAGEEEDVDEITEFLEEKNIKTIDMLILTHFDKDHIGGAAELIASYGITTVLETDFTTTRDEYKAYQSVLHENGLESTVLKQNYSFTCDECAFTVYTPKKNFYTKKEDNNASLIVAMEYGERRFLFCGDAVEQRLDEFLTDSPGGFDFVKLPYHGNYIDNYADFLNEVAPEYGVITCSKKYPAADEALAVLERYAVKVYETRDGTVSVKTDGKTLTVSQ